MIMVYKGSKLNKVLCRLFIISRNKYVIFLSYFCYFIKKENESIL